MTGLENLWHMNYKLMVYMDDCIIPCSYACMHVDKPHLKISIGVSKLDNKVVEIRQLF
jgi:hypothetical protein